jgi:hypothetical protein
MNLSLPKSSPRAYSLLELMVYISVVMVLTGVGYAALYRCMDTSAALRHNADDITAAIHAGERWRRDVRAAGGNMRLETVSEELILHLPGPRSEVSYHFAGKTISRRSGNGAWIPVLSNVKASVFTADTHHRVQAWRWELELQPRKKRLSQIPPLFTFLAVPTNEETK